MLLVMEDLKSNYNPEYNSQVHDLKKKKAVSYQ